MIERGSSIGAKNLRILKIMQSNYNKITAAEANLWVRYCGLQKCYDSSKTRLLISLVDDPAGLLMPAALTKTEQDSSEPFVLDMVSLRSIIANSMDQIDIRRAVGRAPPGAMERLLAAALSHEDEAADGEAE